MTAVPCPHCERSCGGPAGLAAHIRSMHPEVIREREKQLERDLHEALPETGGGAASNGIVWEDPPCSRSGVVEIIVALVPELRRNPGRWARLHVWPNKTGANTNQSKLRRDERVVDIEFVARSDAKAGSSALYGRYVEAE